MKIIATVVERDVEAYNAAGAPLRRLDPSQRFSAYWQSPDGVTVWSHHVGDEKAALASLRDLVRAYLAKNRVRSVEEVELLL